MLSRLTKIERVLLFIFAAASGVAALIAIKLYTDTINIERDWEADLTLGISGSWCAFTRLGDRVAKYDVTHSRGDLLFDFRSNVDPRNNFDNRGASTFRINNRSFFMWEGSKYRALQVVYDPLSPHRMIWRSYEMDLGENVWIADYDSGLELERCSD